MKFRSKVLPRTVSDIAATSFLFLMIAVTFWFELWIVIPEIHGFGSFFHILYIVLGLFVTFNIVGNLVALMLCDTSLQNRIVQPPAEAVSKGWRLCSVCEAIAPPRSWHCPTCDTCILKRDHHCIFSGCCIGLYNHRYFIMLLFHLSLATLLCACYNSYFIWLVSTDFDHWLSYTRILFPIAFLIKEYSLEQYYFLVYLIDMIGAFLIVTLLFYHYTLIKEGVVVHEKSYNQGNIYDLGTRKNFELVFGERYHLTWISPFIASKLPHDGIRWQTRESVKDR